MRRWLASVRRSYRHAKTCERLGRCVAGKFEDSSIENVLITRTSPPESLDLTVHVAAVKSQIIIREES